MYKLLFIAEVFLTQGEFPGFPIGTARIPNWSIIHKFAEIFFRADWITERPGGTPTDPQKSKIEPGFERFRIKFQNPQKHSQQKLKLRKL